MSPDKKIGEFEFIQNLLAPLATAPEAFALGDDAALYAPPIGQALVLTTDTLVEQVHFPLACAPQLVAARLLAANLCDLTAKGAVPVGCLLTLGVAPHWDEKWLTDFVATLGAGLKETGLVLWGGDTVRAQQGFVGLAAHGIVPHATMLRRNGAHLNDDVLVSGTIGDGYLGLQAVLHPLADGDDKIIRQAYESPQAPLHLAVPLRDKASAAIDISDGLLADLDHICYASGVAMRIEAEAVPLSAAGQNFIACAEKKNDALVQLLTNGDDHKIAITAPAEKRKQLTALNFVRIGQVVPPENAHYNTKLVQSDGQEVPVIGRGYRHF